MFCYEEFSKRPNLDGHSLIVASFGVIGRQSDLRPNASLPVLLMKQRNGDGEFPWCFDLPGGAADPADSNVEGDSSIDGPHDRINRKTLQRELLEEVNIRSAFHFRIGQPMFEVRHAEQKVIEYHLFLVVPFGPPKESEEAVNIAWVNPKSALGLRIAGLDPDRHTMGPMAIMMYDGFSVVAAPMYSGPLTEEIVRMTDSPLSTAGYSLLNGGRYFGRIASNGEVMVFRRLNPFEPCGHFVGDLETLA